MESTASATDLIEIMRRSFNHDHHAASDQLHATLITWIRVLKVQVGIGTLCYAPHACRTFGQRDTENIRLINRTSFLSAGNRPRARRRCVEAPALEQAERRHTLSSTRDSIRFNDC
eukprot:6205437-Pleurochrysis_carterae.AAC.4